MNELPQIDVSQSTESPQSTDITSADQIDVLCDAFEGAWLRGELPQIDAFLDRCDESERESLLVELLLVDRELRIRHGEAASRLDYQRRFPQYSTVIDQLDFTTIDDRGCRRSGAINRSATPLPGTKLAHFELLEELGSGASGSVWKAKDSRLQRTVAIKIPRQDSLMDSERDRFLREGQACAQMRHLNVVTTHEVGEDHGCIFIVAEYIDGPNLREWLKQRRLKSREMAELALQIAEGLHHAHERGVIHRDLKPANILMDGHGRPHIADFGLAKWVAGAADVTVQGNIIGTPAYMSPEQARGDGFLVDRRTDVYGLGALLYEMLTGQPPFEGEVTAVVHQVIHEEPPPPRKLVNAPRDLETVCLKAMAKEPSRRYSTSHEFALDLRRYLDGKPISARPSGAVERIWRMCKRQPASASAAFLFLIAAIGVITAASLAQDRSRLQNQNRRLAGFQSVRIVTEPPGAKVAIVPIDASSGEPILESNSVVTPQAVTPIEVNLSPGEYFIEAVSISNGSLVGFAEVYRTVPRPGDLAISLKHAEWRRDVDEDVVVLHPIHILPTHVAVDGMTAVRFENKIRRRRASLPETLFVDTDQTLPKRTTTEDGFVVDTSTFDGAMVQLEKLGKRLPTAEEFEALNEEIAQSTSNLDALATITDLADNQPEWTSSRFTDGRPPSGILKIVSDLVIVKGFGDSHAPAGYIRSDDGEQFFQPRSGPDLATAYRGVHSGMPRFVKW